MELLTTMWALPVWGILIGIVIGYVARSNHFCTLAALERHWYANEGNGVRSWILATMAALIATLLMQALGWINLSGSFYLTTPVPLLGTLLGGLMFGFGMALVGTCGFGAIIRMGGGNMRALVVLTGIALAAISAQRGIVGHFRETFITPFSLDLRELGAPAPGTFFILGEGISTTLVLGLTAAIGVCIWVFKDHEFRADTGKILSGLTIGIAIAAGWLVTYSYSQISFSNVQLEAGSFVTPVGDTIMQIILVTGVLPDYGVGLVVGIFSGAALAAWRADDMRWEACDDARELGRHLIGAFLMGTGGVFALGCTIGQGVSAVSALAFSAPLALGGILLGARMGLSYLLEGTLFGFLASEESSSHAAE